MNRDKKLFALAQKYYSSYNYVKIVFIFVACTAFIMHTCKLQRNHNWHLIEFYRIQGIWYLRCGHIRKFFKQLGNARREAIFTRICVCARKSNGIFRKSLAFQSAQLSLSISSTIFSLRPSFSFCTSLIFLAKREAKNVCFTF